MFGNTRKIKELEEAVETLQEDLKNATERLYEIDSSMEGYRKYEETRKFMKGSDEPWADFFVEMTDEDGRVEIKFDWNKAMIQELRRQGFSGQTEYDIVSALFARLVSEHSETFTQDQMDEILKA